MPGPPAVIPVRVQDVPLLTDADPCDADQSGEVQAYMRLARPGGQVLDLCAHHFGLHGLALTAAGWRVVDDRTQLLRRPRELPVPEGKKPMSEWGML